MELTDEEFDLLDELYFVQSFDYLLEELGWSDEVLLQTLHSLFQKGMIKCLASPDDELFGDVDILNEGKSMLFLATKKGLMAHNAI